MKPEIIGYIVEQYFALPEPRPYLAVQFAKNIDGLRALSVLAGMANRSGAELLEKDKLQVSAVLSSTMWGNVPQIIHAQLSSRNSFEDWLRGTWRGIEQINLLPSDNPLNPFLTKPTKRADLAEEIIRQTLTPELKKYLAEYEFSVSGELCDFYGLPHLKFWVRCGSSVMSVSLDCWGGTISATFDHTEKYNDPHQTQEFIRRAMDDILNELTAPRKGN